MARTPEQHSQNSRFAAYLMWSGVADRAERLRNAHAAGPRAADKLAGELGELATAVARQRAALVYARVRVQDGQGRPTVEKAKTGLLSPAEYALRGIHGL